MKSLTIASREVVLKSGLNDRSRAVQKIVKNELRKKFDYMEC